ncbi:MAG: hypothetical protein ACFFAY_12490 [Promethearchaeota archaeon]
MVGVQIASDFVAAQGAFDFLEFLGVQFAGVLIGLPFYIAAYRVLSVGFSDSGQIRSNWWHRALSFYDETRVGKILILLCLFAPAIGVFFANILQNPDDSVQALTWAMMPWGIACPFLPLDRLTIARLPPEELDEDPESEILPQELE